MQRGHATLFLGPIWKLVRDWLEEAGDPVRRHFLKEVDSNPVWAHNKYLKKCWEAFFGEFRNIFEDTEKKMQIKFAKSRFARGVLL